MATNSSTVDFSRLRYEIKKHRLYFVITFIAMMAIAAIYMVKNNPKYKFHADIIIEDQGGSSSGGGMAAMMKTFSMGSFGGNSVDDELVVLGSHSLLCEAINKLGLQYTYTDVSGLRDKSLYRKSPVEISTPINLDTLQGGATFKIKIRPDSKIDVKVSGKWLSTILDKKGLSLPATVKLPDGAFTIKRTAFFKPGQEREIEVLLNGTEKAFEDYLGIMELSIPDLKTNSIELECTDEDKQRGKDLLNMLVEIFNIRRLREEQAKAQREISFIDDRLATLTSQLSDSERQLEEFKTANDVTDIAVEAKILLEQTSKNKASIVGLQTQLSIFDMICEFLDDPKNRYSMIPVTSGQDYESAAKSVESYNQLILERSKLDMSAKADNKALQQINKQIDGMRAGVIETMRKARESAEIAYNDFVREDGKYATRLKQLPSHERQYIDLYRDTEIKNELYVFLLEQRESNGLKFGIQEIGRIIDPAYHEVKKVWPKGSIVFGLALILSLLFPLIVLSVRAIRSKHLLIRQDLEKVATKEVISEISDNPDLGIQRTRNRLLSAEGVNTVAIAGASTAPVAAQLAMSFTKALKRATVIDITGSHDAARTLGASNAQPLADYLTGNASVDSITATGCGVSVISAASADDIDMLASSEFSRLVESLKNENDIVIIAGDTFGEHASLTTASQLADRIIATVEKGTAKADVIKLDNELNALDTPCGYIFIA